MSTPTPTLQALKSVKPGSVFLCLIIALGFGIGMLIQSGSERTTLATTGAVVFILAGWVISLCLHEFAHAFTAFRYGDHSVDSRGYLTLNPLKYTHPGLSIGLPILIILMGGIGFPGGAVYLHTQGFTKAQRSIVSAVGPLTNLILGAVLLIAVPFLDEQSNLAAAVAFLGFLQITAAILNIIPMPGFDGYGVIEPWLSPGARQSAAKIAPYGFLIIFALILIPAVNQAFFTGIYDVVQLFGTPWRLVSEGRDLFMFWA
ncbi:MAG: site-2 protease family protein [Gordonia sp. (in: high G+C Gram-positive bacteria)]|uniref:site-2 protease family protein n=1 Tax=Gordonia sp. (in: high G+C Gram-positive bacteria) TaxID=84139 RepID=UPI0039E2488E